MSSYQKVSSFDAAKRLPAFRKNELTEQVLGRLNESLAGEQRWLERNLPRAENPLILILGVQRSGSTLLGQLLASRLDVGYCSNLMARFSGAPAVGAFLQKQVVGSRYHECRDYCSKHGVTDRVEEPHEFGYFWARHLGVAGDVHEPTNAQMNKVDLRRLSAELDSVVRVFGRPVVLKGLLCGYFIPVLARIPNVFFLDLQRDLVATASSVLKARRERFGSTKTWWSFRPKNFEALTKLSPESQVAHQLMNLRRSIESGLEGVPSERKLVISYEALVRNPEAENERLCSAVGRFMKRPAKVGEPVPSSATQVRAPEISSALRRRIERALVEAGA